MESIYRRVLFAIGLSLMCVPGSGYANRNDSNSSSPTIEELAEKVVLERNFQIRLGQELTVKGQDFRVKFDSVLEDSRCPKDVDCVWAGDAKIQIRVRSAKGKTSNLELHTNGKFAQAGKYQKYEIKLIALDPYPRSSRKQKPHNYVATLLISRR